MSNNEVTSSENVRSQREKELEEEIDGFKARAKNWYQALNDDFAKERRQLLAENKKLKDQLAEFRKKLEKTGKVKPKTTPPEVRKKEADAIAKLQAENAGYKKALADNEQIQASKEEELKKAHREELKKANEEFEKQMKAVKEKYQSAEEKCKELTEQNNLFFAGIKMHENMTTKLKEKLFIQFGQLNHLRSQVKDPQIPESFLKEEIEEMWSQSIDETKI